MLVKLKNYFKERFFLKLYAIFIAVIIWGLASFQDDQIKDKENQFFVPIVYQIPSNLTFAESPIESVQIVFINESGLIENNHPSKFQVAVNLEQAKAGKLDYVLLKSDIKTPGGIKIQRIIPPTLKINLEELATKVVPIKPIISGELKEGFVVGEVNITPSYIKIQGSKSKLEDIEFIETREVELNQQDKNFSYQTLISMPKNVEAPNFNIGSTVRVEVTISGKPANIVFENVNVRLYNQKYVTRINPERINIHLRGPKDKLEAMISDDLKGYIDLRDLEPGNYKLRPEFTLDPSFEIKQVWPAVDVWVMNQKIPLK